MTPVEDLIGPSLTINMDLYWWNVGRARDASSEILRGGNFARARSCLYRSSLDFHHVKYRTHQPQGGERASRGGVTGASTWLIYDGRWQIFEHRSTRPVPWASRTSFVAISVRLLYIILLYYEALTLVRPSWNIEDARRRRRTDQNDQGWQGLII